MKRLLTGIGATAIPLIFAVSPAGAQPESNIYEQCPTSTELHPTGEGIKCMSLVAGDGMVTMADDGRRPLYVFSFAELPEGGPAPNSSGYANWVMAEGTLAANAPAPTITVDEDDELFLGLTNVGMAMRPDLADPHTVHWHGFPNASSVFDGVPDSSISIGMGATLTYYYNVKDAGTYMYHCHVEATEHMQMGMLGNLWVRPKQNKLDDGTGLNGFTHHTGYKYAYNDGDGSTYYDVEYPIQMGSFDPEFHDASFNVAPLPFRDMRDTYFLLNGRGYPDTVNPGVLMTQDPLGKEQPSQKVSSLITASAGEKILLRISNLNITNFYTLGTNGLQMEVVALDARLLRDDAGTNLYYKTNSVTLGGGQSADVLIDTSFLFNDANKGAGTYTFFLYAKNLDSLSNDVENFGGMMTEIRITK